MDDADSAPDDRRSRLRNLCGASQGKPSGPADHELCGIFQGTPTSPLCGKQGPLSGLLLTASVAVENASPDVPFTPKADIGTQPCNVRFVPKAEVAVIRSLPPM